MANIETIKMFIDYHVYVSVRTPDINLDSQRGSGFSPFVQRLSIFYIPLT